MPRIVKGNESLGSIVAQELFTTSRLLTQAVSQSQALIRASQLILDSLRQGGKLLICGNGGSAADSQHLAAELVVRFEKERRPMAVIALTTDTSVITAEANDHGYDTIFSRQLQALGRKGDVLLAISTSGNSANVILACRQARSLGLKVIGLTGPSGGRLARYCHLMIKAPGDRTAKIQECQLVLEHILCLLLERGMENI